MSIVFLKNLFFRPAKPLQSPPPSSTEKSSQLVNPNEPAFGIEDPSSTSLRHTGSDVTLDVEAQVCDECRPPEENHNKFSFSPSARMISDSIIGLSDGLTVPFALTAGLSSLGDTHVVVMGGLAELISGAISMGLGGLMGAVSEAASYRAQLAETEHLVRSNTCQTAYLVRSIFKKYNLPPSIVGSIEKQLREDPANMVDFLMRFHHQMPEPENSRPYISALTIALSYFLGGMFPLIPYFCVPRDNVLLGLWCSIGVMVVALFVFGYVKTAAISGFKGRHNIYECLKGSIQMIVVGGVAAAAAVGLVRAINHGYNA